MAEGQSMTSVADVVAQVRDGRLEDFVREAVALVAREVMEAEIGAEVRAGREHGPDRLARRVGAVDHEQDALLGVQAADVLANQYPEHAERRRIPASVEAIDGRLAAVTSQH